MTDEKTPVRNWSKKTLTRELIKFCRENDVKKGDDVKSLLEKLQGAILLEEGVTLDLE